ncbi:MAG: hypothetical protein LBC98_02080 [Prevotellaceae bacterium]|jgi:predicted alpha/beta superfamily hydrolase|nr:hypothetical protein [Prevotellaceae bacterium]
MLKKKCINIAIALFYSAFAHNDLAAQSEFKETVHDLRLSYGTVKRFHAQSQYIESRNIDVWFPDDFSVDKRYAVLYMHDGQNLFDAGKVWNSKEWQIDETLEKLNNTNSLEDFIVVGIWHNGNKRHSEYFPQKAVDYIAEPQHSKLLSLLPESGLQADNYLKFIVLDLKPFIDSRFPTFVECEKTFIGGSSMGALISLYAICEYPQIFGGAACLSSHWIGTFDNNAEIPAGFNEYLIRNLPSPENHKIYFDHGTLGLDANYPEYQQIIDLTMQKQFYDKKSWKTVEFKSDDHNEIYWAKRFYVPLLFLLEKKFN